MNIWGRPKFGELPEKNESFSKIYLNGTNLVNWDPRILVFTSQILFKWAPPYSNIIYVIFVGAHVRSFQWRWRVVSFIGQILFKWTPFLIQILFTLFFSERVCGHCNEDGESSVFVVSSYNFSVKLEIFIVF